jgi:hypothetical protein
VVGGEQFFQRAIGLNWLSGTDRFARVLAQLSSVRNNSGPDHRFHIAGIAIDRRIRTQALTRGSAHASNILKSRGIFQPPWA